MKTVSIPIIKTDQDLDEALAHMESLLRIGAPAAEDEIRVLGLVIHAYEAERFRFREPDPVETLQFVMRERGLKDRDLIPFIGSQSRVSEILARKRRLTLRMIRSLSEGLGIPPGALIGEPQAAAA